jgi:Tol biopolymer transport system component
LSFAAGARLGPYEILSALGAGGMGEVYKARDTRLERTVAIKILSSGIASTPELRERFEREARTVACLSHPHICTLHDVGRQDGTAFLVMEYLEGETLEQRLKKGPLPLEQALQIGIQIADALAAAHRAGIVHRDLKPGNIMLVGPGRHRFGLSVPPDAKLLDFGLATASAAAVVGSPSTLLTTTPNLTAQGTLVGTFQYMAPEQLEGQKADARTDIFAFGAVLYEMLTGRKAFEGNSHATLIGAILKDDPPLVSTLLPLTPPVVDHVVKRCLAKQVDDRWQAASDVMRELKWAAEAGSQGSAAAPALARRPGPLTSARLAWMVAAMAVVIATGVGWWGTRITAPPPVVTRFEIVAPPTESPASLALSSDGRQLAYVATTDGQSRLWVRPLDVTTARPLAGTEGGSFPFWAPDARAIGFFAEGKLKRVDLAGGVPQVLADAPAGRGGTWSPDDVILFTASNSASLPTSVLMRVSAGGGTPMPVTRLADGHGSHRWPQFLPDGRFLFFNTLGRADTQGVYLGSLDGGDAIFVLATEMPGVFVPPDRLLLVRSDGLMASRFDAAQGAVAGEPVPLARPVGRDDGGVTGAFSVSPGTLAYRATGGSQRRQLAWMDRAGTALRTIGSPDSDTLAAPALDPAGQRIAVQRRVLGNFDIWLVDTTRGTPARFTFDPALDTSPLWSRDGRSVIFASRRSGPVNLYEKSASGAGDEHLLAVDAGTPLSWSPDGQFLLYARTDPSTGADLWVLPATGERKPLAVVQTAMDQPGGDFSPDGRWLAYESSESGRFEVYVQTFPEAGGKRQVSPAGGTQARWRGDGRELYYLGLDARLMAVAVTPDPEGKTLDFGTPAPLFRTHLASGASVLPGRPQYAVAPDGRFLMNTVVEDTAPSLITIVLNWTAGLQK